MVPPPIACTDAAARWQRVKGALSLALDQAPSERAAFLRGLETTDPSLCREVAELLAQSTGGLNTCAAALGAPSCDDDAGNDPNVGRRIGAWTLGERLGAGGMGTVYLAHRTDGDFEQTAAVKLLRRGTDTEEVLRRFRAERQILARLDHPGIVHLLDGGATDDGLPFFVLEWIKGRPLTVHAQKLSLSGRLRLFQKICASVQYAHERLIVHRDLKPGNILVTADGKPKLLDFGIAKLLEPDDANADHTLPGQHRLTPAYASPEQARGEPVTTASDVYALGALLYEMLVGHSPHRFSVPRPSSVELAHVVGQEPAIRASLAAGDDATRRALRGDLDNILAKALEKEPSRRYPTVTALAEDVRRYLDGRPVRARPSTWRYRAGKFMARNRGGVIAAAITLAALTAGAAGTLWQARLAERRFADMSALAHSFLFEFQDSIRDLPGSVPARRLLVTKALEYLGRLSTEAGSDPALHRELAAAYVQVGDVQARPNFPNLGDTAGALTSYHRATAIAEALPGDDASAAVRSDAWDALGNLLNNSSGERAQALDLERRALTVRRVLVSRHPADADRRRALATSLTSLGDAMMNGNVSLWSKREDILTAEDYLQHALALRETLYREHPNTLYDTRELARVHYRLGVVYLLRSRYWGGGASALSDAMDHHRCSVTLREQNLAAHPASGLAKRDLADGLTMKSEAQTRAGDATGALADCRRGIELFDSLVTLDPENFWAREDLAFGCWCMAIPQRALGDLSAALASLDRAITLDEGLAATDPTSLTPIAQLDHFLGLRAELCQEMGDSVGLRQTGQRWLQCAERLASAGPSDEPQREDLARARAAAGGG